MSDQHKEFDKLKVLQAHLSTPSIHMIESYFEPVTDCTLTVAMTTNTLIKLYKSTPKQVLKKLQEKGKHKNDMSPAKY